MTMRGPILIVEDDHDDQHMLAEVIQSIQINNEIKFFDNGNEALDYLKSTTDKPSIILSDVNLPGMTGIDLKKNINEDEKLRKKSIPFVFLTTTADPKTVSEGFELMVQGFFQKANKMDDLRTTVKIIMDYWGNSNHPDNF